MNAKDRYANDPIYRAVVDGLTDNPPGDDGPDATTDKAATKLIRTLEREGIRMLPVRDQKRYRLPEHPEVTVGQVWVDSHSGREVSVIARDTRSATVASVERSPGSQRHRVPLGRLTSQYVLKQ